MCLSSEPRRSHEAFVVVCKQKRGIAAFTPELPAKILASLKLESTDIVQHKPTDNQDPRSPHQQQASRREFFKAPATQVNILLTTSCTDHISMQTHTHKRSYFCDIRPTQPSGCFRKRFRVPREIPGNPLVRFEHGYSLYQK